MYIFAGEQGAGGSAAQRAAPIPATAVEEGRGEAAAGEIRARHTVPSVEAAAEFVRGLHGELGHAGDPVEW